MSYKGIEMTSQEDYILSDTRPYDPEINIEQLKIIQNKLENYTSGRSQDGITPQEAEIFLDWITFNARSYATRNIPESPITASMTGQCAPTQEINFKVLTKMGLDVRVFNTGDCIGEIPLNEEDLRRVQNGWRSPAVRHSVSFVDIPIIDRNGNTRLCEMLLDPTFRQFCLKENCTYDKFYDENRLKYGYVAPHPGYFMIADNLKQFGVSQEVAQKSEQLCKQLIARGYFYLNEENAKLYGDAFVRASRRIEFQHLPMEMTGDRYIRNFESIPMKILDGIQERDVQYMILPSERKEEKEGIFSRILHFFRNIKNKFNSKDALALPEGRTASIGRIKRSETLEKTKLVGEELEQFTAIALEKAQEYQEKEKDSYESINYNPNTFISNETYGER